MKLISKRSSRADVLILLTLCIMAVFIARLFYLQVIRHSYYVQMASNEQLKQLIIPAKRGEIYALNNGEPVPLVLNQTVYTVFADPKIVTEPDQIIETVERVAGGSARPGLASMLAKKESRYQILATNVTRKQAEMIKQKELAGVGFQEGTRRVYPEGQLSGQVLGFVDTEGAGQYGIEGKLNDRLHGKDGLLQSVTDIRNVPLTIGDNNINQPAEDGDDIVLTIDRNVQAYAEQALLKGLERTGATRGSVLVMDPSSGAITAMASLPTYNPADYSKVSDIAVFNNPVISSPYEPGSVLKAMTVAAGINQGVIGPDTTFNNTDYIQEPGWPNAISNLTKGQTGTITMQHAFNYSLNTGMVTIVRRLGGTDRVTLEARNILHDYFTDRFRLGSPTGVELAGEASGVVVSPDDPNGASVRYSNMSFGQGLDVTMLQTAAAFCSLINGGEYYQPTVVAGTIKGDDFITSQPQVVRSDVISDATSASMRDVIVDARQAFYAGSDKEGYRIGGKTGTSQVAKNGVYDATETIGSYLGFGGNDEPEYVIMVQLSGEGKALAGGRDALPIFTDVSNWMIDYLQLQPRR